MDSLDSWRYGEMGFNEDFTEEPWEAYRDKALYQAMERNPDLAYRDKVMWNRILEYEFKAKENLEMELINIPRKALRKHREAYERRPLIGA